MNKRTVTQEYLKEIFDYNPDSGEMHWKISVGCVKTGARAGTLTDKSNRWQVSINEKLYFVHRIIWCMVHGVFPDEVDHENHNSSDNRLLNLRAVTRTENGRNLSQAVNNTTGVTGVVRRKGRGNWMSQIKVSRKNIYLGTFDDFFEAVCSRKSAENKHGFHPNHGTVRPL